MEVEPGPVLVEKWKFQQRQRAERLSNVVAIARKHLQASVYGKVQQALHLSCLLPGRLSSRRTGMYALKLCQATPSSPQS